MRLLFLSFMGRKRRKRLKQTEKEKDLGGMGRGHFKKICSLSLLSLSPQGNGGRNVRQYSTPMRTLMNTAERLRIQ